MLTLSLLVLVLLQSAPLSLLRLRCWQLPPTLLLLWSVVMDLLVDLYQLMLLLLQLLAQVWPSLKAWSQPTWKQLTPQRR